MQTRPIRTGRAARFYAAFLSGAFLLLVLPQPVLASLSSTSAKCEAAARSASARQGVPLSVLRAIALTETGRRKDGSFQPWPWTVNMEGKGVWFESEREALEYVDKYFKRGARSFDVGCFQLNYKWHGQSFSSIQQMFDPEANAAYAARFLRTLYEEFGNWTDAAGAYHSRTPEFANKYKKRFTAIRANLNDDPVKIRPLQLAAATPRKAPRSARANRFPLLQGGSGSVSSLGSLVPSSAGQELPRFIRPAQLVQE